MTQTLEIIPRRLYWHCDKQPPPKGKIHVFSVDDSLVYRPYNTDFGPLDLSMIYKYCMSLKDYLTSSSYSDLAIYHCTSPIPAKRANSALLICAYQVLLLNKSPQEAWEPFSRLPRFLFFRDASAEGSSFEINIIDCLNALLKAKVLNWFNLDTFDLESYEYYTELTNGGFNWLVPNRFIAFVNPVLKPNQPGLTPEKYVEEFKPLKVTAVVRLNAVTYDASKFKRRGLRHYELFFEDGSTPSEEIIEEFLEICEKESVLAVHCQAGLGRTATIIGCYVLKNFDFTGHEYIAWARMCRSGSVLGPQQHFLCDYYQSIRGVIEISPQMTEYEQYKAKSGDLGQGSRLSSHSMRDSNDENEPQVKYKTRYNQLVKIDPVLLKIYGKQGK